MGIMDNIFLMILVLISFLPLLLLFIFFEKKDKQSILKQDAIKDCLKEYAKNYATCQMVELDSKIKKLEKTYSQSIGIVVTIFALIFIYAFKFIARENFLVGFLIAIFFVFGSLCIFLLTKKPTITKIMLKNNVIELYDSNNEVETYHLDNIDIKYNILGSYRPRSNKYINIYFNNDIYSSVEFNVYNFNPYIAFIIFVNLKKRNELEKINTLNDDDIKRLQENFIYSTE